MNKRERICAGCSKTELTFSKADKCNDCHWKFKRSEGASAERAKLVEMGYLEVEGPFLNEKTPHRHWTFTHRECGTRQTWRYGNILKQLKLRPNDTPCSRCGGKERMSKAMAAFVEKYRITDVSEWRQYKRQVGKLTNAIWKLHESTINPLNLPRGLHTYHLDHRKSVIQCYLDGDSPEFASRLENLEMLPAFDNLSKGRKCH